MTDTWDRTLFDKELKSILDAKLPVSASKIQGLQALAISHPQHHNYIVQCIVRFIETAPPDYRLAGLYVVDAISRAVHKTVRKNEGNHKPVEAEGYLRRFGIVLRDDSLLGCFEPCSTKDKEKVKRTLDIWEQGGVYSKELVEYIKQSFMKVAGTTEHGQYNDVPATNVVDQTSKAPAIDAETLLAQLSSLSNGNLGNLAANIAPSRPLQHPPQDPHGDSAALPPALARLFGINDATPVAPVPPQQTPSPTAPSFPMPPPQTTTKTSADPRLRQRASPPRRMDPRIQQASANNTPLGTRHSQPQQQPQQQQQPPVRTRPSRWNQDSAPPPQHHLNDNRRDGWHEPPPPPPRVDHRPPPRNHMPPRRPSLPGPISDTSLPKGAIKVLTRTLFVGPLPGWFGKEDVANIFEQYGELHSIIMSKKIKTRVNAFLKYTTRASLEAAMQDTANLVVDDVKVKVNFGFGFGPRKLFNYDSGESIIPLNELSEDEKSSLVTAPVGGFQGLSVRDQMIIEEPEVQYRPEWKMDENSSTRANKSRGPPNNDNQHHNSGRHKRRRFDSNDDQHNWTGGGVGGGYPQQQQHHQQPMSNVPPNFFFDMQQQLQQQEQQMQQEQQYQENGQAYYQPHYDYS